ncbi:MAG: RnfABCDGE type electron transport complex subunit B [Ruminococcaceae bacterium]|nr:RnfABCDGE type electron transport complex subunit B [Oscillospiraceae bacterium]
MLIDVLTALAVVVSVSLFLGILLALFINFFTVKEDEKEKKIRECLPGINCGACGYTGCNEYAKALALSQAKPNLCIPGAENTAKALSEILGVEVEEPKDVVAFVHCNGTCDAAAEKAIYQGVESCKARTMLYGGSKGCSYGCFGCGDCAKVCVSNAIFIEDGIARVDTSKCVGCGLCVKQCPQRIISMVPQETKTAVFCNSRDKGAEARKVCTNACIACKKCEKVCPHEAISVINNRAVIDYEKCTGCGACTESCPTGCIKNVHFRDLPEGFSLN